MDTKRWIIFIVLVVGVIAGMIYMSVGNRLSVEDIGREGAAQVLSAEERNGEIGDHVIGNKDAKVVAIEYGDFQCPGCRTYAEAVKPLLDKYGDNVALVYRHFPLAQMHPNARAASAAAVAASLQDNFWQMHDMLFERQQEWAATQPTERSELFVDYARQLGLDEERFKQDLADPRVSQKINFDTALGRLLQVTGTPSFFVNGEPVDLSGGENGPSGVDAIEQAIDKALAAAGVEIKSE